MRGSEPRRVVAHSFLGTYAALAAAAWMPLIAPGQPWQELGPAPITSVQHVGRISAIACHPTEPNTYYACGADGGVWRSTNGGASWTPLTDAMPTTATGAIALDPLDPNILYVGTGEANYANHSRYGLGVFKSVDGGATWTQLAAATFSGRCFSSIVVNPLNAEQLFAGITRAGGFPALAAAKGHPGANGPVGVFRSDDGGQTWTALAGGLPTLSCTSLALDAGDPNVVYAGIGHIFGSLDNGVFRSRDGGATWQKLFGGLPVTAHGRVTVATAPSRLGRAYALITNASDAQGGGASTLGAFRSDNGGDTWTSLPVGNIQASYGWFLSVVSVRPSDPNTVLMGGLNLVRSTNAGATWTNVTPPHVDLHALAWDAAGRLLAGDDGGVHRTSNVGSSWAALNGGLGTIQFYAGVSTHPSQDDVLLGGMQDNGSNYRGGGGAWTQVFGGDGGWTQIDAAEPNRLFVEFQGTGNLYRSLAGPGGAFLQVNAGINPGDRNCFEPPYLIHPGDSQQMLYATHRLYRSLDGGASWSALSGDLTGGGSAAIRALAISPADPNYVYVATNDGRVLVSADEGATAQVIATGVPGWPRVTRELCTSRRSPLTAYLAVAYFGQAQVRRTLDAGASWEALDGDLPDVPVNVIALDERAEPPVLYAGADDGVYRSIDDGATWRRLGGGLPRACVIDLRLDEARGRLIAATQGRGAWVRPASIPGDVDGDCLIGQDDLDVVLFYFGQSVPAGTLGDADGDGDVDQDDLDLVLFLFGRACL